MQRWLLKQAPASKPRLRGVSHGIAALLAILAGAWLIARASGSPVLLLAAWIYASSVTVLFVISAVYHLPNWKPAPRALLRKLDHCAIYILISGTLVPLAMVSLEPPTRTHALIAVISAGALGIGKSLIWAKAPKPVSAAIYVAIALVGAPFLPAFGRGIGTGRLLWFLVGALIYIAGAVTYALKRPNPVPGVFTYHEVFHLLVIIAAAIHFGIMAQLIG